MKSEPEGQSPESANRQGATPTSKGVDRHLFEKLAGALTVSLVWGVLVTAQEGNSPTQLRRFIDRQVGGIQKLMVPAHNSDLPQPRLANGSPDPLFQTTEAKRYLGKQLFHDPARMTRILPEFGGVLATSRSASCGTCHLGEAASKAGTLLNFAVGGEGRHFTDAEGNLILRRRPRLDILPILRQAPLFPGDALVDEVPTLTDIFEFAVGTPARGSALPDPGQLVRTGRLDALDSVARKSMSIIGAAFNNRLLFGGFAGEPDETPGGLNPFGHVAQENVALLLLDAHRLLDSSPSPSSPGPFQSAVLREIPTFRKLFRDAFPEEAAKAPGCLPEFAPAPGVCDVLINDLTVLRATATFMRTVVTRNTPWDRFLAGDNGALTGAQRRGVRLFFTPATGGGAGCFSCHSGPMLNKQVNDPDVAGVGQFLEENFFNLGLADHPLQALNAVARNDPNHRDDGRREITFRDSDAFEFRTLTLRQIKDGRNLFHNGLFTSVKDVVKYFNAGVPQDAEAAAASTFTTRFSFPRGPGSPRGLGLSDDQVDDLTDFIENGLLDPAFVNFDPNSTTDTFQPNERDLTYSIFRPDLAALGAVDGRMASGLPPDNDDALSRRDMGLEFLDVTGQVQLALIASNDIGGGQEDVYQITNTSSSVVDTHLLVLARGLADRIRLENASGIASTGDPYLRVFLRDGVLLPGQSIVTSLRFRRPSKAPPVSYSLKLLSGQGNP
jgi:cytochrome c peroxidase